MKPYPAYKDSGFDWLGEIPAHWNLAKLKYCFPFHIGWTPSTGTDSYFQGQYLWATIADLQKKYIKSTKQRISDKAIADSSIQLTPKGSLLYSFKLSVGKVGFACQDMYTNEAIISIPPTKNTCLEYYYYLLPIFLFRNANENIYSAKLLNQKLIKNSFILSPPLEEQDAIVAFLERQTAVIDKFITNKRRLIGLLEEQKQAVINTAVTQGLDTAVARKPSGIDWLGDIPVHWQLLRNKYIFTDVTDRSETGEELQLSVHQQLGIVPRAEIADRPMDEKPPVGYKHCQIGDLVLNRLKAHLGVFFRTELEGIVSPDYTVFRPIRDVSTKYYEHLFRHPVYVGIWKKTVRGIVAGFYRLYTDDFGDVVSVFPPPEEQREIVEYINDKTAVINTTIKRTQREIALIEEYRITLIAHAVTGKIDIRPGASPPGALHATACVAPPNPPPNENDNN